MKIITCTKHFKEKFNNNFHHDKSNLSMNSTAVYSNAVVFCFINKSYLEY